MSVQQHLKQDIAPVPFSAHYTPVDDCLKENGFFTGVTRLLLAVSCILLSLCSIFLHLFFVMVCQKLKGWKSNFCFWLLQIMSVFSVAHYMSSIAMFIHVIFLFESKRLAKIIGAFFEASVLSIISANFMLTAHRIVYTLFPISAPLLLNIRMMKLCISLLFGFYFLYLFFVLSPLASVLLCPSMIHFQMGPEPYTYILVVMNEIFVYLAGVVNIVAYAIIFGTLYLRGMLTFKKNSEIRMTLQAAIVSLFELIFFLYWEYGESLITDEQWGQFFDAYTTLLYFDILTVPYLILNQNVKEELKKVFFGQGLRRICSCKIAPALFIRRR